MTKETNEEKNAKDMHTNCKEFVKDIISQGQCVETTPKTDE